MMTGLKTSIWVAAIIRRAEVAGAFAALSQKGDDDAGAVLVKICTLDGNAVLYRPIRNMEGERVWLPKGPIPEREIDQAISKRTNTDPDLWGKQAQNFLICLEMLLFSIAHFYCFPTDEWQEGYQPVIEKKVRGLDNMAFGDFVADLKLIMRYVYVYE